MSFNFDNVKKLLPGAMNGLTGVLIGYPFDTIKVRQQTNYHHLTTMSQCIQHTWKNEGFLAFYRGSIIPFTTLTTKRSYQYMIFDLYKDTKDMNPYLIGAMSGVSGTWIGCPMHVVKINMQNSDQTQFRTSWALTKQIYKDQGILGFYRGFWANMFKDCLFGGLFLGNVKFLTDYQKKHHQDLSPLQDGLFSLFKGGVASSITWTVLFPVDTIKTTIQIGHTFTDFKKMVSDNGIRYMWRGLSPVLIRTLPASTISMLVYDKVSKWVN